MTTQKRRRNSGRPDPKILAEIVQNVVAAAQPDKIVLFGSAARGEMGPDSDIDLLIIKSGKFNHDRLTRDIYRNLTGAVGVDALVVTPEVLEQYGDSPYLVYYPALREGKVIYDSGKKQASVPTRSARARSQGLDAGARRVKLHKQAEASCGGQVGRKRYPPTDPREWINRAKHNLARAGQVGPDAYLEDLCFDAQQAAEKAIKAVFIHRGLRFPYVHNLKQLLRLLDQRGINVPKYVWKAEDLTRFAFEARYPGRFPPITPRPYRRAVRIAEDIVRWAERQIAKA
jgi:HEPN domain-containing protein/predicted nucleotidyltransferase